MSLTTLITSNWDFDQQVLQRSKVFQSVTNQPRLSTSVSIYTSFFIGWKLSFSLQLRHFSSFICTESLTRAYSSDQESVIKGSQFFYLYIYIYKKKMMLMIYRLNSTYHLFKGSFVLLLLLLLFFIF
jgi:hypothetical protein